MLRRSKKPGEKLAPVADAILDQFGPATGMSMAEIDVATRRLKRALVERMLGGELSHHLGYPPGGTRPDEVANHRNGSSPKTVLADDGPVALDVPREPTAHLNALERAAKSLDDDDVLQRQPDVIERFFHHAAEVLKALTTASNQREQGSQQHRERAR